MPELPEVETTLRGIAPHIEGKTVSVVAVREPRLRWPVPSALPEKISGQPVERIYRRAKYLLFSLPAGTLLIHLGMSGSLRIVDANALPGKHDHVDMIMMGGQTLRYCDPRRFGAVLWLQGNPMEHPLLSHLGPEPFDPVFSGDYLYRQSRGRKVPVKTFLMDNKVVVGVGNIYANEALYASGIRPDRAAGKISNQRYQALVQEVVRVLSRAIEQGGTTLRDFVGGDGKPGYFQQTLNVYGRAGQPCRQCGKILREIRLGQRTTVFCSNCQR